MRLKQRPDMHEDASNSLFYKRSLFTTRLPRDRFYTQLHYWLLERNGTWRIGLTRFATRLIGEIVDYGFDIEAGAPVRAGQVVGWIEGFKAVSDIRSALDGSFRGSNSQLSQSPEVIDR